MQMRVGTAHGSCCGKRRRRRLVWRVLMKLRGCASIPCVSTRVDPLGLSVKAILSLAFIARRDHHQLSLYRHRCRVRVAAPQLRHRHGGHVGARLLHLAVGTSCHSCALHTSLLTTGACGFGGNNFGLQPTQAFPPRSRYTLRVTSTTSSQKLGVSARSVCRMGSGRWVRCANPSTVLTTATCSTAMSARTTTFALARAFSSRATRGISLQARITVPRVSPCVSTTALSKRAVCVCHGPARLAATARMLAASPLRVLSPKSHIFMCATGSKRCKGP
mmetsp:Transcript_26849/g.39472  ORF Transcript_26849/g.39472 Transcript_26849/m.39472 type:complete len:276 (+) Transcript_26849:2027-2854(+)